MKTSLTIAGASLLAALLVAAPVRAASLDKLILSNSGEILATLKDEKVKTVGVLPFRIKKGGRAAGFNAAPLATSLPGRLENALIVSQGSNEKTAIRIIRDATGTAAKAGVGSWTTSKAAFARLFATEYQLAWGSAKYKPDAFLTGEIINSPDDRGNTVVVLELIRPTSWKDGRPTGKKLLTLKSRTDRETLRDLGYAYALPLAKVRARGFKARTADDEAIEQVGNEEKGDNPQPGKDEGTSHSPENIGGMQIEIEYDGVKQEVTPLDGGANAKQPLFQVPAAKPGQKVVIYLTRIAEGDEKIGVVLRVNGKSVFEEQDGPVDSCKRWIYDARKKGTREDFAGFYFKGEDGKLTEKRFKVMTAEESATRASEMGTRAGWIDLDVFVAGEAGPGPGGDDDDGLVISTRGATRVRGKTLAEVQKVVARANNLKLVKPRFAARGGLITMDSVPANPVPYRSDDLPNARPVGGISIRYFEKATGGGKIVE